MSTPQKTLVGCCAVWMLFACISVVVRFVSDPPKRTVTIKGDWNRVPSPEMTKARKLNYDDVRYAICPAQGMPGSLRDTVTSYLGPPESIVFRDYHYIARYTLWDAKVVIHFGLDNRVSEMQKVD